MGEEEIKNLLCLWWHYYRLFNYSDLIEIMFYEALEKDYYPILKVATYLNHFRQDNYPLAQALYNDEFDNLVKAIDVASPYAFKSPEAMANEEERLLESLRFFATLNQEVPLVRAYDDYGNELRQ